MTAASTNEVGSRRADGVRGRAFFGAAAALAVLFMGNNLPSALYGLLRAVLGFSPLVQTLLYAVPVVLVVLPGLLVFGTLSDVVGRRALVLAGLAAFAAGDVSFMLADDTDWLFAARLAQGLGIALATAASTGTLSDSAGGRALTPSRRSGLRPLPGRSALPAALRLGHCLAGCSRSTRRRPG